MQPVIPLFPGTKPYQQIPFQYSLHYIKSAGGPLLHKEFLAESGENPLQAIAEALCRDIPMNVCVTAYNKSFECSRIKELAGMFPDLSEHLLNIKENIKDLLDPFQAGHYYNRAMGGSFSIKSVLPAIFPDDPELNYHNLEGVHNGSEAMTIFPRIKAVNIEEFILKTDNAFLTALLLIMADERTHITNSEGTIVNAHDFTAFMTAVFTSSIYMTDSAKKAHIITPSAASDSTSLYLERFFIYIHVLYFFLNNSMQKNTAV